MFLRKMIFILGMLIILSSCSMDEDDSESQAVIQFKYETHPWGAFHGVYYPVRFFHTNPICTGIPEHMVYYKTEPGQYYMEYVLRNNKAYYIIYTIEIWKTIIRKESGGPVMVNGEVKEIPMNEQYKRFTIDLSFTTYDYAPIWDDDYYADGVSIEPIRGEIPSRSVIPHGRNIGPLFGRIKQEIEGGSITIEYGILNEGE